MTAATAPENRLHGIVAEFSTPEALLRAAARVTEAGYRKVDAYSPFPIHGLDEALRFRSTRLPWIVLAFGLVGLVAGYGLQYWTTVIDYPINVAGRPLHSAPAFVPIAFETTILFAALAAAFGMLALNGLPSPYHPLFTLKAFERASRDKFFLCVEARDPLFHGERTRKLLATLEPDEVYEVEA